jgi:hypothetical protein
LEQSATEQVKSARVAVFLLDEENMVGQLLDGWSSAGQKTNKVTRARTSRDKRLSL